MIAHELTHVLQRSNGALQRKPAPKSPPTFAGCTPENTLIEKPNRELATTVTFASDLVNAAIGAIAKNDMSETFRVALARHFINPNFQRADRHLQESQKHLGPLEAGKLCLRLQRYGVG